MRIVQLIGPQAGEVVDVTFAAARRCVDAGTARWPDGSLHGSAPLPVADLLGPVPDTTRRRPKAKA